MLLAARKTVFKRKCVDLPTARAVLFVKKNKNKTFFKELEFFFKNKMVTCAYHPLMTALGVLLTAIFYFFKKMKKNKMRAEPCPS